MMGKTQTKELQPPSQKMPRIAGRTPEAWQRQPTSLPYRFPRNYGHAQNLVLVLEPEDNKLPFFQAVQFLVT